MIGALRATWCPPFMAEASSPKSWAEAFHSLVANLTWILPLVAAERLWEGHYYQALGALIAWLANVGVAIHSDIFIGGRGRRRMAWIAILLGAAFLTSGIYLLAKQEHQIPGSLTAREVAPSGPIKTSLKLQFFGDNRIPKDLGSENVRFWWAQFSPSIQVQMYNEKGEKIVPPSGLPGHAPNWNVFVTLEKPTTYKQIITTFSHPEALGPTEIQGSTDRSFVFHSFKEVPAGILEIQFEQ